MEEFPEELRTPPVSLISLVGCTDLHSLITNYLNSHQPPINALAFPHLSAIPLLISSANKNSTDPLTPSTLSSNAGILKKDWLLKHRSKLPSVIAALFPSNHVFGDPTQWLQVCSDIDDLKALIRPKNIKLLIVVVRVHSSPDDEINEDRTVALRKRAEVDSKFLIFFNPNIDSELSISLHRLGSSLAELATTYYRDEGRRVKTRIEKKNFNSTDFNVRYCFKVAVFAEFRRDWAEALKFYEDAYHSLREMVGTSTSLPSVQRFVEIKTVAEQLHFKISTLLLHGGKITEAVKWFGQHYTSYQKLVGAPEVIFLHWEWLSRQYLVFAELLETSSATIQSTPHLALDSADRPLTEWEFHPAYYYQSAAQYLQKKRSALELVVSMSESHDIDSSAQSVVPSTYVGQFARLLEQGDALVMQSLTDEEYTRYTIAEGSRFQDAFEIIALLKKSHEAYSKLEGLRMSSFCAFQIAKEYFAVNDYSNAKQFFDGVANLYRQEGWVTLLWDILGYQRECSKKLGAVAEFIEYSLEMAALPISSITAAQSFRFKDCGPGGPPSRSKREHIHKEVFDIVYGEVGLMSLDENNPSVTKVPLHLEIDLVSPLRSVLIASAAFQEQTIRPGASSSITLSLLSQLPLSIDIEKLEVQFNQSKCNFVIMNAQKAAPKSSDQLSSHVESAPSLELVTNKWLRLTYDIKSDQSGKLECLSVTAKMGPNLSICCRAESPASMGELPLWKYEDRMESLPTTDPALALSGQKATQVEEPDPQVNLTLGAFGPALVGEEFIMPVTVTSIGHDVYAGELKINLVDVKGGGLFSPRETKVSSLESHHVELLGISGPEGGDESQLDADNIKRVQQSFGLISVPFLSEGESWSCKLVIKWHRPKPVMLFVSLGYSPYSNETNAQKIHNHKSLQIEGKTAIVINHRFMLPFRRDPLLLSWIRPIPGSDQMSSLPMNETSVLVVCAKNCTEIPLKLHSMSIEANDSALEEESCSIQNGNDEHMGFALVPGEEFKKVFTFTPKMNSSKLRLGAVHLKWKRDFTIEDQSSSASPESLVLTRHELPRVDVEASPLVVSLDCPPYAILGDPLTFSSKILNQTQLLQEVKITLADSQSFVLSGSHSETLFVLPKSECISSYKVVPLASGLQQLPRLTVTSVRYSAEFQPSTAASTIFVFPSKPQFEMTDPVQKVTESVVVD